MTESSNSKNNINDDDHEKDDDARPKTLLLKQQRITQQEDVQKEKDISNQEWRKLMAEFFVFVFSLLGIIFNGMAISSCQMVILEGGQFFDGGYGLFLLRPPDDPNYKNCRGILFMKKGISSQRYPNHLWDPNHDPVLAFAQVGGILSLILGILWIVNLTIRQFFHQEIKFYKMILFLAGMGIQVALGWMSLIWYSQGCNDFFPCTIGEGTILVILSHIVWFLACILTRYMRAGKRERKKNDNNNHHDNTSKLQLQLHKERERRYEMEYLPVGVSLLIMGLFIFLALRNINKGRN